MDHLPTNDEWAASIFSAYRPTAHSNAARILAEYHSLPGGPKNTEQRKTLLVSLGIVAKAFVVSNSSSPYVSCFADLGMRIDKQIETMRNAAKAWGTARKIFAPSQSHFGKSNALQHHQMHDPTPTSSGNYWLESLDPKHRSWGHEDSEHLFDRWKSDTTTTLGFFDWLEHKNLGQGMPQVQYLAPDERWKYLCVFGDDKLMYRHRAMLYPDSTEGKALDLFTTHGLSTVHSGVNFAIWVCSPEGTFYTFRHILSKFHHSTFLSGNRVLAAGEWVVSNGKLLLISHKTGHYAATPINLYRALQLLKVRVDLSKTVVQITNYQTHSKKYFNALQLIANAGKPELCDEIIDASGQIANIQDEAVSRCARNESWNNYYFSALRTSPSASDHSYLYASV